MTIRNLDSLFDPPSIAVVGASARIGSLGNIAWQNLSQGNYPGQLFAVNLKHKPIVGHPVVAHAKNLPQVPALAVICTPPATVAGLIAELARLGTRAAVVLTPGLSAAQKLAMLAAAKPYLLRILGPTGLGFLAPGKGINASMTHIDALPGELAFVSQSDALAAAMLDWARGRGIGFSHLVALGEQADIDFGDMLDYLASDPKTRAILMYVESIASPKKFMSAARAAARNKPVILVKAARSLQGQLAASFEAGALISPDLVFEAAIDRAGMLRVNTLQELFLAAQTLARFRTNKSESITVLTNGSGAGVLAADAAAWMDVPLARLDAVTQQRLERMLPTDRFIDNPIDIMGDSPVALYEQALKVLLDDPGSGAVLFLHAPTALVAGVDVARALLPLARPDSVAPPRLLSCWLGDSGVAQARQIFQEAGIATYDTPEQAVRAFSMLRNYRRNQAELTEAPPALPGVAGRPDTARIQAIVQKALAEGRDRLTQAQTKAVLEACHIQVVATRQVHASPAAAVKAAQDLGFPVVLKILSDDIAIKSDVGGVALNLKDETDVRAAARTMLARVRRQQPSARIQGFAVQVMLRPVHAQELRVGSTIDPLFGPVILFGQGGVATDVLADLAVALPPLNIPLARALVARTRVSRLLAGWDNTPAVDQAALHEVLVAVSQLLAEVPQIAELDINPLIVNFEGAVVLDACIRLDAAGPAGAAHFAIRPYPIALEDTVSWQGRSLLLRPIRPDDEARHMEFLQHLDPEDIRMRVFYSRRTMERSELARLVQVDYAREMAFVALAQAPEGGWQTLGVARALADPDNVDAEFGVIVRSELKGQGLGTLLMDKLVAYLRAQGTQRLVADVLSCNERMLKLSQQQGFVEVPNPGGDGDTKRIALELN